MGAALDGSVKDGAQELVQITAEIDNEGASDIQSPKAIMSDDFEA
jgi:hypothetical protein